MGIRFYCPNGHKLNVKSFQAGRQGICPFCGMSVEIPVESTRQSARSGKAKSQPPTGSARSGDRGAGGTAEGAGAEGAASRWQGSPSAAARQGQHPAPGAKRPGADTTGHDFPTVVAPREGSAASGQPATAPGRAAGAAAEHPLPAAGDPLAEAPEAVWYVRPAPGGQFGPATAETMRSWIGEGRVRGDSLVWREGWRDWREASATFPQLEADDEISALSRAVAGKGTSGGPPRSDHRATTRRRNKSTNTTLITGLVLTVIVLLIMLVWIIVHSA